MPLTNRKYVITAYHPIVDTWTGTLIGKQLILCQVKAGHTQPLMMKILFPLKEKAINPNSLMLLAPFSHIMLFRDVKKAITHPMDLNFVYSENKLKLLKLTCFKDQ